MSQNLIALNLTADDIAAIDAALATLETRLAALVELSPDERRSLAKMGDKSEAFCRPTLIVLDQNRQIVPAGLDLAAAESDLQQLDLLRPRLARLRRLTTRAEDTEMALGSDVLSAALEGYALAKVFGKGAGLDALRDVVSVRFSRIRNSQFRTLSLGRTPCEHARLRLDHGRNRYRPRWRSGILCAGIRDGITFLPYANPSCYARRTHVLARCCGTRTAIRPACTRINFSHLSYANFKLCVRTWMTDSCTLYLRWREYLSSPLDRRCASEYRVARTHHG